MARRWWILSCAAWICAAACAARQPSPAASSAAIVSTSRNAEAEALPDAPGKRILQASCTSCHDLGEVTKFRGYYNRAQWRDIVMTMVEYGVKMETKEVEMLSDYLEQHLGRK
jgi:cytochrome c5